MKRNTVALAAIPLSLLAPSCSHQDPAAACMNKDAQETLLDEVFERASNAVLDIDAAGQPITRAAQQMEIGRMRLQGFLTVDAVTLDRSDLDTGNATCGANITMHLTDADRSPQAQEAAQGMAESLARAGAPAPADLYGRAPQIRVSFDVKKGLAMGGQKIIVSGSDTLPAAAAIVAVESSRLALTVAKPAG